MLRTAPLRFSLPLMISVLATTGCQLCRPAKSPMIFHTAAGLAESIADSSTCREPAKAVEPINPDKARSEEMSVKGREGLGIEVSWSGLGSFQLVLLDCSHPPAPGKVARTAREYFSDISGKLPEVPIFKHKKSKSRERDVMILS